MNHISVCFTPALYQFYTDNESVVVIVDIFRATTSMCTAFENGIKSIKTVASVQEAKAYKTKGYLVAAERNTRQCDFADFGNSPFDFTPEKIAGKDLIFTTTNGTKAVDTAKDVYQLVIGAFSNISAVADHCIEKNKNIVILCSGWNDRFCLEDTLFAGALSEKLINSGNFTHQSDSTRAALDLWYIAQNKLIEYICTTEHYVRLKKNGLENAVEYCLTKDTVSVVPMWNKESGSFINKKNSLTI